MRELQTNSHCKNLILYHLIFVCKYRRKCFSNMDFAESLKQLYWKARHLWTRGYFCSTVGNVSADTVHEYLERQGRNEQC